MNRRDTDTTNQDESGRPLDGRVAWVTGAARGQGRAHAQRLAADGAIVIATDLCDAPATTDYPGATPADLAETVELITADGGTVYSAVADCRDLDGLGEVLSTALEAVAPGGRLDVVVANAGIAGGAPIEVMTGHQFREMIDIDLTGVWNTVRVAVPHVLAAGNGGSIVLISSANGGLKAPPNLSHYAAAKHGVVGIVHSLANELGPRGIRVNSVHPTAVDTDMIHNDFTYRLFRPDLAEPTRDDVVDLFTSFHSLPVPWIDPADVSEAVAFLASDASRYITGVTMPIDAGLSAR
ncbi:MAG: mycofactocin-coupled SDR family oxidoreductase [Ilumatobacter sp.]|uniref:mycofactocin-coupled SDR family oxidoreductase n=1 Tax=Ilumatobacter sp. TaxID=1967498 RepID=UPI00391A4BC0